MRGERGMWMDKGTPDENRAQLRRRMVWAKRAIAETARLQRGLRAELGREQDPDAGTALEVQLQIQEEKIRRLKQELTRVAEELERMDGGDATWH